LADASALAAGLLADKSDSSSQVRVLADVATLAAGLLASKSDKLTPVFGCMVNRG
jgi:hypothetical protein